MGDVIPFKKKEAPKEAQKSEFSETVAKTNKYGLSRTIPSKVKREVRTACGHGCVICGSGIIEYEHIDPTFAEAKEHLANAIALLCPQCHAKVTRGFLSKESIKEALSNPLCKRQGFSNEFFDFGTKLPYLAFAGVRLEGCSIPIMVKGVPLLEIMPPEEEGAPFRLSGCFYNSRGELSLEVVENEWRAYSNNWDFEATGGALTIRDDHGQISLRLVAQPPNGLIIEKLNMLIGEHKFTGDAHTLIIHHSNGGMTSLTRCLASNCKIGILLG